MPSPPAASGRVTVPVFVREPSELTRKLSTPPATAVWTYRNFPSTMPAAVVVSPMVVSEPCPLSVRPVRVALAALEA
jgi:hypothetical protein